MLATVLYVSARRARRNAEGRRRGEYYGSMSDITAPSAELETGASPANAKFLDAIAGIHCFECVSCSFHLHFSFPYPKTR